METVSDVNIGQLERREKWKLLTMSYIWLLITTTDVRTVENVRIRSFVKNESTRNGTNQDVEGRESEEKPLADFLCGRLGVQTPAGSKQ